MVVKAREGFMPAKKHLSNKSSRQKKLIHSVPIKSGVANPPSREEAIVRQFHRIQRGYSILMSEVYKEFNLVKGWIEKEAHDRREELKERFSARAPKT